MKEVLIGIGVFCLLIGLCVLFTFEFSYLNGVIRSAFFGLGCGYLAEAYNISRYEEIEVK